MIPPRNTINKFKGNVEGAVDGLSDLSANAKEAGKNLGQLAAGLADDLATFAPVKQLLKCIGDLPGIFTGDMCKYVLNKVCDCEGQSHLKFDLDATNPTNSKMDMRCIVSLGFWAKNCPKDTPKDAVTDRLK